MESLKRFEKNSSVAAGIALILYAVIGFTGNSGFLTTIFNVAVLAAGITCFIEKSEALKICSVSAMAAVTLVNTVIYFFRMLGNLFRGYINLNFLVNFGSGMIFGILQFAAYAALAVIIYMLFKGIGHGLLKYWYAPSVVLIISAFLSGAVSVFMNIINGYFSFSVIFGFINHIIYSLVLSIGCGLLSFSMYIKTSKTE